MSDPGFKKWLTPFPVLIFLFAFGIGIGLLIAGDFGQDIDEPFNRSYGRDSRAAYAHFPDDAEIPDLLKSTGSAYLMAWVYFSGLFSNLRQGWLVIDGGNLTVFLTFTMGVYGVYLLARKFVSDGSALFAAILFATQPLLFGHGFINQKDTPFMVFFILGIAIGMSMVDHFGGPIEDVEQEAWKESSAGRFYADVTSPSRAILRLVQAALLVVFIVLLADVVFFNRLILPMAKLQITAAYAGEASPLVNALFQFFAIAAVEVPLDSYLDLFTTLYSQYKLVLVALLGSAFSFVYFLSWPDHWRAARQNWVLRYLLPAGFFLGLTAAVRPPGVFASALVALYFIFRYGRRGVIGILMLLPVVGLVTFLTWPTLWVAPPNWFFDAVRGNLSFGGTHIELYRGQILPHTQLPRDYVIGLMSLQLTIPALVLGAVGILASFHRARVNSKFRRGIFIIILWFAIPLLVQFALRTPIYNNFRQLLFLLPPLFVFSAIGFQHLIRYSGRVPSASFSILAILFIIPGLLGIIRLHPYQYTYYNEIAGGVSSAQERFQLDYWCTSYRELAIHLNRTATEGALVAAWGPVPNASPFAREDLTLLGPRDEAYYPFEADDFDYALVCHLGLQDEKFFPEMEIIFEVEREGATMGVLKAANRSPGQ